MSTVYPVVIHNAPKSVNRSILKKTRHLGFGVFMVHSSMGRSDRVGGNAQAERVVERIEIEKMVRNKIESLPPHIEQKDFSTKKRNGR